MAAAIKNSAVPSYERFPPLLESASPVNLDRGLPEPMCRPLLLIGSLCWRNDWPAR